MSYEDPSHRLRLSEDLLSQMTLDRKLPDGYFMTVSDGTERLPCLQLLENDLKDA